MNPARSVRLFAVIAAALLTVALLPGPAQAAPAPTTVPGRYLVVARTADDYAPLRDSAARAGAKIVGELPQVNTFVITGDNTVRDAVQADSRTQAVAVDHVKSIATSERRTPNLSAPGLRGATKVDLPASAAAAPSPAAITPDPAFFVPGLQWDYRRIGLPEGWQTTAGRPEVTVGVADTGLDFTHADLEPNIRAVVDLTELEDPPLCETLFGVSDQELAAEFGGPATTDWNGHGSWIGGNIAAVLNGTGINGIAPRASLVSLKISQWCGFAYDSTTLAAFLFAAATGLDEVSISFGGYLDRSALDQEVIYQLYVDAVEFAQARGTTIVSSAGNEHVRIGAGGRVLSHGQLTTPGETVEDLHGLYETPGGVPGVVDVSATNNVVNGPSANCPEGTTGTPEDPNATCKPTSDRHQPTAVGQMDQLSYYSNYGPRIDIAAPGGARKFNLPLWDRGGTPGFPYTSADGTNVWEDFSTTSNWAVEIPCFTFSAADGFPEDQCYSTIQGTSMATPHVSAAIALTASAHPDLRYDPAALLARVQAHAVDAVNHTPVLSATDTSPGDLTGVPCPSGYCHLGGPPVSNAEAYGAGLLNVANP
jgi:lantibiotic leader peptide-processing serine protease